MEDVLNIDRMQRSRLFTYAWTIVDQLHVVRQILESLHYRDAEVAPFIEKYECAALLRNRMDHLHDNIPNLANARFRRPPVFGVLSYFLIPSTEVLIGEQGAIFRSGRIITVSAGALSHRIRMNMPNPGGRELRHPVSGFQLEAFDQILQLEEAALDLEALLIHMDSAVKDDVTAVAAQMAEIEKIPIEDILNNHAEGLILCTSFEPKWDS